MNTKTCKRCGWEYPISQPGTKCLICGESFDMLACSRCGAIFENRGRGNRCPKCDAKDNVASYKRRLERMEHRFDEWLDKVKLVPKNYPTLTEQQWIEACSFFNGCARCDSEEIDTRGFFINRSLGGRYCDWNIIPMCSRCAKLWQDDRSAFKYAHNKDLSKNSGSCTSLGVSERRTEFRDNLEKIVSYLGDRLDNAIGFSGNNEADAERSERDNH